jgi:hypothetical protein
MDDTRLLTILVELDSRKLGGSMLLLSFSMQWLEANKCREMLMSVLTMHLDQPTTLAFAESVKMFCTKQDVVTESGLNARVGRDGFVKRSNMHGPGSDGRRKSIFFSFAFKLTSRPIRPQPPQACTLIRSK